MTPEERERLAEQWMDEALQRGAKAEPRPGLEARVLARLEEAAPAPLPFWRRAWRRPGRLAFAPAVAALLVVAVLYFVLPRRPLAAGHGPSHHPESLVPAAPNRSLSNASAGARARESATVAAGSGEAASVASRHAAMTAGNSSVARTANGRNADPDDELLWEVSRDLQGDVPPALAPAEIIVAERNRLAKDSGSSE
jgi:hypothetical protein